jgi:hypothetical protein
MEWARRTYTKNSIFSSENLKEKTTYETHIQMEDIIKMNVNQTGGGLA